MYNDLSKFEITNYPDSVRESILFIAPKIREIMNDDADERNDKRTAATDIVFEAAVANVFGDELFRNFIEHGESFLNDENDDAFYEKVNLCIASVHLYHLYDIGLLDFVRDEKGEDLFFLKNKT